MRQLSLKLRSLLFAVSILAIFTPVSVFVLDEAYTDSLTQAKMSELRLMNLGLLSAFELDGDVPYMPEILYEEQLNLPGSGYLGLIVFRDQVIWQSASALEYTLSPPELITQVGNEAFVEHYSTHFDTQGVYFAYAFTAEFASSADFEPVHFYIFNDKSHFSEERGTFLSTVWQWLAMLALVLLVFIVFGINLILSPVRSLIDEISLTSQGKQQKLNNRYPKEFTSLKASINELLHSEAAQRVKYKNSLGDLAHSLKTPLAVALGTPRLPEEASESLGQIDRIIQRQLKRAGAGATGWQTSILIEPVLQKVANAMDKVHRDKQVSITLDIEEKSRFRGDETDLLEMCGNLIDNGCKAAKNSILVTVARDENWLSITVDDDGPGIAPEQKQTLLERGARLDTYTEGQGIGMALVNDLISAYEGKLIIDDAPLGGARVIMKFPIH